MSRAPRITSWGLFAAIAVLGLALARLDHLNDLSLGTSIAIAIVIGLLVTYVAYFISSKGA